MTHSGTPLGLHFGHVRLGYGRRAVPVAVATFCAMITANGGDHSRHGRYGDRPRSSSNRSTERAQEQDEQPDAEPHEQPRSDGLSRGGKLCAVPA